MRIVSDRECCGCAACCDICPEDAVSMQDTGGFWRPVTDEAHCTGCGLCRRVCPARKSSHAGRKQDGFRDKTDGRKQSRTEDVTDDRKQGGMSDGTDAGEKSCLEDIEKSRCYAAWSRDKKRHYHSASGGLAGELSEEVIRSGGFVAGVIFDSGTGIARHIVTDRVSDIPRISKSKYVLSNKTGVYRETEKRLADGQEGLFIGVPCEVNAVYAYLDARNPGLTGKLITADLLCHGGSSPRCLREHLAYVSRGKHVRDVTFRGGRFDCRLTAWSENWRILYQGFQYQDAYFKNFMRHCLFQEACYVCPFAGGHRQGDITLGDFWGIAEAVAAENPLQGMNMVLVNSRKGRELFLKIKSRTVCFERDRQEAVRGNDTLKEPTEKPEEYDRLWRIIPEKGFDAAMKNVYGESEFYLYWKNRFIYYIQKCRGMIRMVLKFISRILQGGGLELCSKTACRIDVCGLPVSFVSLQQHGGNRNVCG